MPSYKFTENFFLIPVQVFHDETENYEEEAEFATAWARIPYDDLFLSNWYEGYNRGKMAMATSTEGFDFTVIRTPNAKYLCTWPLKEFERHLNKFMEKVYELHPEDNPDNADNLIL